MIEQVIEARAAKEGVDHIIFAPRVVTHPKKQLSDQEQAFCQAYWELAELRLSGIHPLVVAIGGIARKLGVEDQIEIREYLGLTVLFDHDVTDDAPVARFLQRLKELMESGYGLNAEENL